MQKFVRSFQTPLWIEQSNSAVFQNQIKKWQYCYLTKYVCTTYSTVLSTLLTVQCGVLYYLHSTPTIYLFIQLSKRHVCTQLSSFCLFPCFFLILVLSKLFFPIPIVCIVCLVHTNSVTRNFLFVCSPAMQPSSAYFSRHILFLSIFLFPFFVFKKSLFSLRRLTLLYTTTTTYL